MTPLQLRSVFVSLYLVVDILYVVASRSFYEGYAKAIQGKGFPKKTGMLWMAAASYACLALAWWVLVASTLAPIQTMIFKAFVLALGVYGVFNATLYVMFERWDSRVVIRDTLWGVSWLCGLTALYAFTAKRLGYKM